MDTTICGATAFHYWRTPPIVLLLAAGPEDDDALQKLADPEDLFELRSNLYSTLPLAKLCLARNASWKRPGADSIRIRNSFDILAPWATPPLEVLVSGAKACHSSSIIKPRVWKAELSLGSREPISDDIFVTSPAFTLLQLAPHLSLAQTVLLASELCGTFAIYKCPAPIKSHLEKLHAEGRLFDYEGWKPSFIHGGLSDLWTHEPLIHPTDLEKIASDSPIRNGKSKLIAAARLTTPNAASPFEIQAGVLLGFPKALGGEGHEGFAHNVKVTLSPDARALAQRDHCYCDLMWDERLDLECQSTRYHNDKDSFLSDSDRTTALRLMGIDVLPVTFSQLKDKRRFAALSNTISGLRGTPRPRKTKREQNISDQLRDEVLVSWNSLI